ncbi:hypothetical protein GPECTOR_178g235 [Gonium pectorale]|uniref:RING-type domain-containing protein n=1 Tax=Gonium pectorale TaxID=33097 RepID=A0A150FX97_GONPE|nr:hypothetical protein GPECTOR_178g235 [Gonium pectorale]|eukprot:KXZ42226.1 hypothetical protein GPECTOR_178g235 [Gonium pectorale]
MPFDALLSSVERNSGGGAGGGAAAALTAGLVAGQGGVAGTGGLLPPLPGLARPPLLPRARSTSPSLAGPDADDWPLADMAHFLLRDAAVPVVPLGGHRGRGQASPGRGYGGRPTLWAAGSELAHTSGRPHGALLDAYGDDGGFLGESSRPPASRGSLASASSRGGSGGLPLSYEQLLLLDESRVRRGVRPEVVRALPTRTAGRSDASSQCQVCLERFTPGATRIASLPCAHAFCAPCIRPWLAANATCPVCRWAFPPQQTRLLLEPPERPAA